ncbi:MAG: hypothetical protein R3C97_12965 [Geminicoccaceae bacterium]
MSFTLFVGAIGDLQPKRRLSTMISCAMVNCIEVGRIPFDQVEVVMWHITATIIVMTVGAAVLATKLQFPWL